MKRPVPRVESLQCLPHARPATLDSGPAAEDAVTAAQACIQMENMFLILVVAIRQVLL